MLMDGFAQTHLHMRKAISVPWERMDIPPDVSMFVPGVDLSNQALRPVWPPDVHICIDKACLTAPLLDGIALSYGMGRLARPGAGGRLLILCDSFGIGAASAL